MKYVVIKNRAPTINGEFMPLFIYTEPLKVIEEKDNTVVLEYNNNDSYVYEFKKEFIEKSI